MIALRLPVFFRREGFWCKSIEVASSNLKETNKPRQEPAGHGVNSVSSASGPKSLAEVP